MNPKRATLKEPNRTGKKVAHVSLYHVSRVHVGRGPYYLHRRASQAYFQHYNSLESYVHMPRKEYGSRSIYQELHRMSKEDGLNVEIERLNAPTHQKGHAGAYATSFDAFVALRNPNVVRLPLCRWQRR